MPSHLLHCLPLELCLLHQLGHVELVVDVGRDLDGQLVRLMVAEAFEAVVKVQGGELVLQGYPEVHVLNKVR